jgi:hypothetical protein
MQTKACAQMPINGEVPFFIIFGVS